MKVVDLDEWMKISNDDDDDNIDDAVVDDWLFIETTEVFDPITFHEYVLSYDEKKGQ